MKITVLLENTACRQAICEEHGLSLLVESEGKTLLFDMGQTDLFAKNAEQLGVDLSCVDLAVLSHGHYDHGGGLATFLAQNSHAPVYLHRDAFLPHYNGQEKYIGLDVSLRRHPRLRYTDGVTPIGEGMCLYSCNDRERAHHFGSFGLTEKVGDTFVADDFRHEQYLLVEEKGRRILLSGCSHKGVEDIVAWFTPDVLIGGFHFSKIQEEERLLAAARHLDSFPTVYYTCHCTGEEQTAFLQKHMKRLYTLHGGQSLTV